MPTVQKNTNEDTSKESVVLQGNDGFFDNTIQTCKDNMGWVILFLILAITLPLLVVYMRKKIPDSMPFKAGAGLSHITEEVDTLSALTNLSEL